MSRSKHTEVQMIAALKQVEAGRKAESEWREDQRCYALTAARRAAWARCAPGFLRRKNSS